MSISTAIKFFKYLMIIKEALGDEQFKEFLKGLKSIGASVKQLAGALDELADLTPFEADDEWAAWIQEKLGIDPEDDEE